MSTFNDGCTAGPLSEILNQIIGVCCFNHDQALDHSFDIGTFVAGNVDFFWCAAQANPLLAIVVTVAVSSPVGLYLYWFGPKRKDDKPDV